MLYNDFNSCAMPKIAPASFRRELSAISRTTEAPLQSQGDALAAGVDARNAEPLPGWAIAHRLGAGVVGEQMAGTREPETALILVLLVAHTTVRGV